MPSTAKQKLREASDGFANKRAAAKRARAAKKRARGATKRPWLGKFLLCALCVGGTLLLALYVGDSGYHATALGWIPFIMVVSAIALAWVYLQILKRCIKIEAKSELHDCRRGDDIAFNVHFTNRSPLYFFRIEAYFYVSDLFGGIASDAMTTLSLSPFEKYDLGFTTKFEHIGTYTAGMNKLVICDFLHLFTAEVPGDRTQMVHVTPRVQSLEHLELSTESQTEAQQPRKSVFADSLDYAYVRPYVPGDPLKTIHWKLSARTEGYMTRLFEENTNPGVAIILDFYTNEDRTAQLMGMFDAVVETAFSVGNYAKAEGLDTEMYYTNRDGEHVKRISWNTNELDEIIADMPNITNDAGKAEDGLNLFSEQLRNQYGQNNLVICTANLSARLVSAVIDAKVRRRNPLLFAVVPSDLVGRELDEWTAPLKRLDEANIGYRILTCSDDLLQGVE